MPLFVPTYFSPISQYGALCGFDHVTFEVEDNFQKQTYRNRCYIYGANGKQLLNIPIVHHKSEGRKKTKDIQIQKGTHWKSQHVKSLKTAYNSSPFFEFYEDDLMDLFSEDYKFLLDLNIKTFEFINDALELGKNYEVSKKYEDTSEYDFRILANAKLSLGTHFQPYTQMFDNRFGFIENLSILDLLFMEGPNTISFLEKLDVTLS